MARIGNSRTISDIEYVIEPPSVGSNVTAWVAHGVKCARDQYRFSGQSYSFSLEVVDLRQEAPARQRWHVVIIGEVWRFAGAKSDSRGTRSLRVIDGKASDILSWMRRCREQKLVTTTESK
ncbi:hypothetical protein [Tardiphaga robiniae]|uniref:Uncharacterized protein n=1 Tax=Tardiphaga robiniae TaxID=943830 RepID=A0A7G6TWL3_9BRAD|nr:hypothetical protein [Tardiphaga robiniae]QND71145.1 hypothetical protein HB776_07750 [Tardiphaga robiniae]